MNVEIRGLNLRLNNELREHCEQRLVFALDRFADRLRHVVVRLSDVNGPRGGMDKRCQLELVPHQGRPLHFESTDINLPAAVDHAAHRASQALAREFERERRHVALSI